MGLELEHRRRRVTTALIVGAIALGSPPAVHAQDPAEPFLAPLDTAETLAVYIAAGEPGSGFEPHDRDLAQWALESWTAAAEGKLAFRATTNEAEALVRVYFVPAGAGQYGEMRGLRVGERRGAAVFVRPDTSAFGGSIARRAADDPLFRDTIVYLTCLHELGHALGLVHTADYADIMYAFGYGGDIHRYFLRYRERLTTRADIRNVSALSAGDVGQVRRLYLE